MLRALRHRDFRWYWLSTALWAGAFGMQFLILGVLVLKLTDNSSTKLGLMIFVYGVPNLVFVLFGGIFADRVEKRKLLIATQAVVTISILALATVEIRDHEKIWHVYAVVLILGTVQALNMPARQAIVAELVPQEDVLNAVALSQSVIQAGRIIGPPAAGGIIELAGIGPALYFNAAFYLLGSVCVFMIRARSHHRAASESTILRDFATGLSYFRRTPVVSAIVGIGFATGFFAMPHLHIMPAFAKEVLGVDAAGAGVLLMAFAIGSLLGSIGLAALGNFQHKDWLLLGAVLGFGATLFLFAWSPWYWVSWVILLFVGMGGVGYVALGNTVLQITVPPELLGRVFSLWSVGAALVQIGALPMGVIADLVNWHVAVATGATGLLAVALWLGVWRPTLRQLKV